MASISGFTCINCHVAFPDAEVQRFHYKTDWHRYNLKRQIADLPPVTAEQFRCLVLQQQQTDGASLSSSGDTHYCQPCRKPFRSRAQFLNHVQSHRHIDNERRWLADKESESNRERRQQRHLVAEMNAKNAELCGVSEKTSARRSVIVHRASPPRPTAHSPTTTSNNSSGSGGDSLAQPNQASESDTATLDDFELVDTADVQSDGKTEETCEWEDVSTVVTESVAAASDELWTGHALPPLTCLFCSCVSACFADQMDHMALAHSFFVPDIEYVCDLEGLVAYLGQKIGEGFVCLWCNERGKHFYSLDAVQKHMRDKGHTKMLHEGDVLLEYADFYDYSSSYPDCDDVAAADAPLTHAAEPYHLDTDGYMTVLPSGAVIGHRSLFRYYRQRLRPLTSRNSALQSATSKTMARYRKLGLQLSDPQQVQRTVRDMRALRRYQQYHWTRLGVKANKLQPHFRQQCPY